MKKLIVIVAVSIALLAVSMPEKKSVKIDRDSVPECNLSQKSSASYMVNVNDGICR